MKFQWKVTSSNLLLKKKQKRVLLKNKCMTTYHLGVNTSHKSLKLFHLRRIYWPDFPKKFDIFAVLKEDLD